MEKEPSQNPQPLEFQALSKGLGFHPFSEGLPYSPQKTPGSSHSQKSFARGTGAVMAGPPTFAPAFFRNPPQAAESLVLAPPQIEKVELGFTYLLARISAFFIDLSFSLLFCGVGLAGAFWKQEIPLNVLMNSGLFVLSVVFVALAHWLILTVQEVIFHTSLGKRVFGLVLSGNTSQIILRALLFFPSFVLGGVGIAWALLDSEKRCWHDRVCGLQPKPFDF